MVLVMISSGVFLNYFIYPQMNTKFKVIFDEKNEFNHKIIENCESIRNGNYRPNFLMNNRHIQSIYNISRNSKNDLDFKIQKVFLESKTQDDQLYDINDD